MTTGSGLYINPREDSSFKQNTIINQLAQGRSNAVGTVTLTHDGATTTTTVTANTCGPNSAVFLSPTTAHAATALSGTYISAVAAKSFTITHAATSNSDVTFYWVALG